MAEANQAPSAKPDVSFKESLKSLAKALAKAVASSFVRAGVLVGLSFVLNLVFSVVFFFSVGLAGGGHGGLILFPAALIPFIPPVVLAAVLAQKNGVMRIAAAAVESQAPALAEVCNFYLGRFLRERYGDLQQTRGGAAMDGAWQKYVAGLTEAPWVVRTVLGRLSSKVPIGETVAELASNNVPSEQVPRELTRRLLSEQVVSRLQPGWGPVGLLLLGNVLWLPLSIWLARLWLQGS